MKTITKYKAIDGKEFNSEKDCITYESLIKEVDSIMSALQQPPNDDGCRFANGHGYIQHDLEQLGYVRLSLLNLIKKHIDHKWIDQAISDETVHPSWVGRLVGEYDLRPIDKAWYRFSCIDKQGREFGQPFYANNPEKAELIKI